MEWDLKVKMGILAQNQYGILEYQDFVVEHIQEFDVQAWDIFLTTITLTEDDFQLHEEFYERIRQDIDRLNQSNEKNTLSLSARFRLGMLMLFYSDLPVEKKPD